MLDKGHGSAVLAQFADILFEEGAPRVVIDPARKYLNGDEEDAGRL